MGLCAVILPHVAFVRSSLLSLAAAAVVFTVSRCCRHLTSGMPRLRVLSASPIAGRTVLLISVFDRRGGDGRFSHYTRTACSQKVLCVRSKAIVCVCVFQSCTCVRVCLCACVCVCWFRTQKHEFVVCEIVVVFGRTYPQPYRYYLG